MPSPQNPYGVLLIDNSCGCCEASLMETGIVKWYDPRKGHGYIKRKKGTDLFVYHTEINAADVKTLKTGDQVVFDVFETEKGRVATNVRKALSSGKR